MPLAAQHKQKYAYCDYLTWPEGERWELIAGEPLAMTPAPSLKHQRIAGRLYFALEAALSGHPCTAFIAPVDVVLANDTVVQPDVLVVCDASKLEANRVAGAPDLIVEVLSPATALRDHKAKRELYERHGVREYVLADPEAQFAERFTLGPDGVYGRSDLFGPEDVLSLSSLGGLKIRLSEVFERAL